MRLILIPVANRPECRVALDAAFGLAAVLEADVAGYHIRPEQREQSVALGPLLPGDDVHVAFTATDPKAKTRAQAARRLYEKAAAKHGFAAAAGSRSKQRLHASWHEAAGTPARVFAVVGPVADLTVVSRPLLRGAGTARAFLLGALLHSAKPVLVVPQSAGKGPSKSIAIAWNQSADAARAVTAALPLLTRADRVLVVSAGTESRLGPKVSHLERYLARWGIKIERQRTSGRHVEQELERAYREFDADLLVMGAYSRSRWSQLVLGGVTEHMLFRTDLRVLTLHR